VRNAGVNLTQRESELIDATEAAATAHLDTDALMDLHARVRRARNKYVMLYRRRGAAKVRAKGARGVAAEANERGWAKAEVFEEALARVSHQLAAAAQRSAQELKRERLDRARKGTPESSDSGTGKKSDPKKTGKGKADRDKTGAKKSGGKKAGSTKADSTKADSTKADSTKAARTKEKAPRKTTGRIKSEASSKASGARRQAKRDSR